MLAMVNNHSGIVKLIEEEGGRRQQNTSKTLGCTHRWHCDDLVEDARDQDGELLWGCCRDVSFSRSRRWSNLSSMVAVTWWVPDKWWCCSWMKTMLDDEKSTTKRRDLMLQVRSLFSDLFHWKFFLILVRFNHFFLWFLTNKSSSKV